MYNSTEFISIPRVQDAAISQPELEVDVRVIRHQVESPWAYADADRLQREHARRLQAGETSRGLLLISEFAPTITYGKRAKKHDFTCSHVEFSAAGIDLYPVDRGGLATYHGPGQWVVFFVEHIERLTGDSRRVSAAVRFLLERTAEVAKLYRTQIEIREKDELGVWTERGKCAAVGIRVSQGVLLHGICINGFRTEQSFYGIVPCGLEKPVDFLLQSRNEADFSALGEAIQRAFLRN